MKLGVGLITCRREEFCRQVWESLEDAPVDVKVLVQDAGDHPYTEYPNGFSVLRNEGQKGVGHSKNRAFSYLLSEGCDLLFLIEDDILVRNPRVFEEFVQLHEDSGIHHFNFGLHGPTNRLRGRPVVKSRVLYRKSGMDVYSVCIGAFSVYSAECLRSVGMMDGRFMNAGEHLEHTYRICQAGRWHPPYWWFADLLHSDEYLQEIEFNDQVSVIRSDARFQQWVSEANLLFVQTHGVLPMQIPPVSGFRFQKWVEQHRKDSA